MGKRMVRVGSYWKRRQLGLDHEGIGTPWELHMRLPVGAYVEILEHGFHPTKGSVHYVQVGSLNSDVITDRLFRMYFQEVRDKAELGLIKLAEQ